MHDPEQPETRSATPASPALTNSLYRASSTVDELTLALANFSRVPSPEPAASSPVCCCAREDCANAGAWATLRTKLESRLTLSAEIGQALLQKHEAYVRRYETNNVASSSEAAQTIPEAASVSDAHHSPDEMHDSRVGQLERESLVLEKRLTQALIDNEIAEAATKSVLEELEEARSAISRLTTQHAHSVGLESRLKVVTREISDVRQERNSEAQRAKVAEARVLALKEKLLYVQAEVRRLEKELEIQRSQRLQTSERILQDARGRIQAMRRPDCASLLAEETEIMEVLESLVVDNERHKRDNVELQTLLYQSREDLHTIREELEEQRIYSSYQEAEPIPSPRYSLRHGRTNSTSGIPHSQPSDVPDTGTRRNASRDSRRTCESLTPMTDRSFLSSLQTHWEHKRTDSSQSDSRIGPADQRMYESTSLSIARPTMRKSLLLLSCSRAVQTEGSPASLTASTPLPFASSPSPSDPQSESSSLTADIHAHSLSHIVECAISLLNRMSQADTLSLTNRLKRQHLKGGDVGYLSRVTVSGIVHDAAGLRMQFRSMLEGDKVPLSCTRRDIKGLFGFLRDVFTELGEMRITLNEVILDPLVARRVRESAMNPNRVVRRKGEDTEGTNWMKPLVRLFAAGHPSDSTHVAVSESSSTLKPGTMRPRVATKLGPALGASSTTVNVEFSGSSTGRSVTNTSTDDTLRGSTTAPLVNASASVMGIFAGAPRAANAPDAWIKVGVPTTIRRSRSRHETTRLGSGNTQRSPEGGVSQGIDEGVKDARMGGGEVGGVGPLLLHRTLRRRGLSDSSIHTTFMSQQGPDAAQQRNDGETGATMAAGTDRWLNKDTMLRVLSRGVRQLRIASGAAVGGGWSAQPLSSGSSSSTHHNFGGRETGDSDSARLYHPQDNHST